MKEVLSNIKTGILIAMAFIAAVTLVISAILGLMMLLEIPERTLFNDKFGTNYTPIQWCLGENIIKDYIHKGEQKQLNINITEND